LVERTKVQIILETTEVARHHNIDRSLIYRWRRVLGVRRGREAPTILPVEVANDLKALRHP
jgi:transposase-like protein